MRTLQIVGDSNYGGGGYLLIKWCRYLSERAWHVDVLATDSLVMNKLAHIPARLIKNIYIPREIAPLKDVLAFTQLTKLLRKERYDVVHTYTATPSFLGRLAARFVGTPVVLHHQAGWTVNEYSRLHERLLYTPLEYLIAFASTKSICVSHAIEKQGRALKLAPNDKLVTIPNGIDSRPFITAISNSTGEKLREDLEIPAGYLLVGNTGRLAKQKDNETLIKAVSILRDRYNYHNIILALAGDGPERDVLKALVSTLGLDRNVRFLGFFREIPAFLASLDVFVNPSYREGLSISIMEAMASRLPIVTTSISANAELIEHEATGLLFPPRDPDILAKTILRFLDDRELADRCGMAAQQKVLESYTIDSMFHQTWDLYISLLDVKKEGKGK